MMLVGFFIVALGRADLPANRYRTLPCHPLAPLRLTCHHLNLPLFKNVCRAPSLQVILHPLPVFQIVFNSLNRAKITPTDLLLRCSIPKADNVNAPSDNWGTMQILELTSEVFRDILVEAVQIRGLKRALRLRLVASTCHQLCGSVRSLTSH